MADDDDDKTLGEFRFASFESNVPNSLADAAAYDDDEWGDFVKSPQQSKPSDPYFNGNHPSHSSLPWTKPSGALPFSLFGDAEKDKYTIDTAGVLSSSFTSNNYVSNNTHNLTTTNLYDLNSQINGSCSPGRVENGLYSSSNPNGATSALSEWENVNFHGTSDHTQVTKKSDNDEFSFESNVSDPSPNIDLFSSCTRETNGSSSKSNTTTPNVLTPASDSYMNCHKQESDVVDDDDDGADGWEFKDANSEFQTGEVNNNVHFMAHEVSESSAYSSGGVSCSNGSFDLFGTSNRSIDFFAASTESVDYFVTSSDTYSNIEQNNTKGTFSPSPDVGGTEFDEDFGEFTAAAATAAADPGPKPVEDDVKFHYHKGALPLSIFGYEEPETGGSSDLQDAFMHQSTSDLRNSHTPSTVISVNDLISSLYSQAEQISSINTVEIPTKFHLSISMEVSSSNLASDADDLDDSSWDFTDASQPRVDTEASLDNIGDTYLSISSKMNLNNYLDFYFKLKEELCFVAKFHIENLQQARANAAVSAGDARVASLDSELQLLCKELEQMNFRFQESSLQYHPSEGSYVNELVEVLLEPQFQMLESEYHLSQKLLQVEKDLRSAIELIMHTTTMLKILTVGTLEERTAYISIWAEMVSVCAQELKHGASIWNQAVTKHVQTQLLSEPQGRKFVLAIGEIYRVLVVLGASAKLFKPWTLSVSLKSPAIYILLEECHALWSTSGLEGALSSVSEKSDLNKASILLKSIKHILGLDALALQNHVFTEKGSLCRLSILTEKVTPGMKMIMWGEEKCFVTLANVWANLISRNPPNLPHLNLADQEKRSVH